MQHTDCVISAVGRDSLHRQWTKGEPHFDLHLIVYDDSLELFRGDTEYLCHLKGYKLKIIYQYLELHPELMERYEYFFLPDDDIQMDASNINALFEAMRHYRLKIAQPALCHSYYSWPHTLKNRYCRLRYTNFVEMMLPCFSREALKKVLFTFNKNGTGWGTEAHWHRLIGNGEKDMAIIDEITAVHTRPIQTKRKRNEYEMLIYLKKYHLTLKADIYDCLPAEKEYVCDEPAWSRLCSSLHHWLETERIMAFSIGEDGYFGYAHLLFLLSRITEARKYADAGYDLLCRLQQTLGAVMDDLTFRSGISGCCWLVEYLHGEDFIEDDPQELLEEADAHLRQRARETLNFGELAGLGRYMLAQMRYRPTEERMREGLKIAERLEKQWDGKDAFAMADAIELLQACGRNTWERIKELEWKTDNMEDSPVERLYLLFRLFLLTDDRFYLMRVREGMKHLKPRLMTLEEALMLAEIMYQPLNTEKK